MSHIAYVETPQGVWRETDGRMEGPFTREELGFSKNQYLGASGMVRVTEPVSLSFGFGYGPKADNRV